MQSRLEIRKFRLPVHLGWGEPERAAPQPVDIDVTIHFAETPPACTTDDLSGAICYAGLTDRIRSHCQERRFRLIERLAAEIYETLLPALPNGAKLTVSVTKVYPPIPELLGGATLSYGPEIQ